MGELLQQAVTYFKQGNTKEALAAFEQAIRKDPENAAAYTNYGVVLRALGQLEKARQICEHSIHLNANDAIAQNNYAVVLMELGFLDEALDACLQSIRLEPQYAEAHSNCGIILKELGRMEEAQVSCEHALQLDPQHVGANTNYAIILNEFGHKEEALVAFERVIQLDPNNANAYVNLAGVLKGLGRNEEAVGACEQAIRLNPENAGIHISHGIALKNLHRDGDALAAFDRAILLNQESSQAYYNRAEILKKQGRQDEAIEELRTALKYSPGMVDAEYLLASLGAGEIPAQSPVRSTKDFFDNYADHFDNKLVNKLKYATPQHIYNSVINELGASPRGRDVLDLGCGTGLCGVLFADLTNRLVGVDLAPRMLEKAKQHGVYTDLVQMDVCQFLEQCDFTFDLVLSADVFVYIGDLGRCFALVHERMKSGGLFAFSIEVNEVGKDYLLTPMGRYAQSLDYIRRLSKENNFYEVSGNSLILRYDEGMPVSGYVFVLRKMHD